MLQGNCGGMVARDEGAGRRKRFSSSPSAERTRWGEVLPSLTSLPCPQFVVWNSTLRATVRRHYLEYFDEDSGTIVPYQFPTKLLDHLPMEEPLLAYKTCAVVGNSGITLVHAAGKEIDAHDAVFRMNLAPVRGFEEHVGSRTTFQIVNSPNIREMLTGNLGWRTSDNETRLVMFETATRFARHHLAPALLEEHGPRALLLNPTFSNHCHKVTAAQSLFGQGPFSPADPSSAPCFLLFLPPASLLPHSSSC